MNGQLPTLLITLEEPDECLDPSKPKTLFKSFIYLSLIIWKKQG